MIRLALAALVAAAIFAVPATANASSLRYCGKTATGWTLRANAATSCSFARATHRSARTYQRRNGSIGYGERARLNVYSFTTGRWYVMRCNVAQSRPSIDCRGGNGAHVVMTFA